MTSAEIQGRLRYLQAQGRQLVRQEVKDRNALKIKTALLTIRDYYTEGMSDDSDSVLLSRKIDCLNFLIED